MDYSVKHKQNHVEVYDRSGQFLFSSDTVGEAHRDILEQINTNKINQINQNEYCNMYQDVVQ